MSAQAQSLLRGIFVADSQLTCEGAVDLLFLRNLLVHLIELRKDLPNITVCRNGVLLPSSLRPKPFLFQSSRSCFGIEEVLGDLRSAPLDFRLIPVMENSLEFFVLQFAVQDHFEYETRVFELLLHDLSLILVDGLLVIVCVYNDLIFVPTRYLFGCLFHRGQTEARRNVHRWVHRILPVNL